MLKKLLKIARLDHWCKNIFIVPGIILAIFFLNGTYKLNIVNILLAILATCFVASANYIINEYLDRNFDKYHPTKKNRTLVLEDIKFRYILMDYLFFAIIGCCITYYVQKYVFYMEIWLLVMGLLYNVPPVRLKDVPVFDVLTESVNNIIRLFIGWFVITIEYLPPISVVFGYWMIGAFLMTAKRYTEYRIIPDKNIAGLYRKSFKYYTENKLLLLTFFYAIIAVFFSGIFIVKYRVELVICIPFIAALFCYYFSLSYKEDSAVAKPEKLYKEKNLMFFIIVLFILGMILLQTEIPILDIFLTDKLIKIQ